MSTNFHRLVIHQVRTLVFDNYQTCTFRKNYQAYSIGLFFKHVHVLLVNWVFRVSGRYRAFMFKKKHDSVDAGYVLGQIWKSCLKALDTFGNCQKAVLLLGVSQPMHEITNLWTSGLNLSSKLQENDERKNTIQCCTNLCTFRCLQNINRLQAWEYFGSWQLY